MCLQCVSDKHKSQKLFAYILGWEALMKPNMKAQKKNDIILQYTTFQRKYEALQEDNTTLQEDNKTLQGENKAL